MSLPGIVVGLRAEARIVDSLIAASLPAGESLLVACSGASAERATVLARELIERGADCLISFGIAGGLDPILPPGSVILGDHVMLPEGGKIAADAAWIARAQSAMAPLGGVTTRRVAGADQAIVTTQAKAALYALSGAAAVDMESHAVARIAAAAGRPFLVLRAIADPAGVALPRASLVGLGTDGRARPLAVLDALARQPSQTLAVLRAARQTRAALASLRRVVLGAGSSLLLR